VRLPRLWPAARRSTIRERAARSRDTERPRAIGARLAIALGLVVGLVPAAFLLLQSARLTPPLPIPDESVLVAAARTVATPSPTKRATPRPTPTPWPLDLWSRSFVLPTPDDAGGVIEDAIPTTEPVVPVPGPAAPTPPISATQAPAPSPPTPTTEPEPISAEEIAQIEATARAAVAAESGRAAPAVSSQLGGAVPDSVRRWESIIVSAADRYKVDPNLIAALMMTESEGNPNALSRAGAVGLMQIMHGPQDPAENVRLGTAILADNLRRYSGRVDLALAGYNAGNGAVAKHGGIPPYRETRDHVFRVLLRYELYKSE
jgi:hypothetical protein